MRRAFAKSLALMFIAIGAMTACLRRAEPPAATMPTVVTRMEPPVTAPVAGGLTVIQPSSPSSQSAAPSSSAGAGSEAIEPLIDLEMSGAPVRLVLQRLADLGGLRLIIPPDLDKTISVQYVRIPVSVALTDVLSRSGLRLGAGPAPRLPFDTVTVFYPLPANVDSMSADAIVRRFGISRATAELIVKSRRP
jgi:hypothetical protein